VAAQGLDFVPTHPKADQALPWMGFEARKAILEVLDRAIADKKATVSVIAYDLNEPEFFARLEKLGKRLRIIVAASKDHGLAGSAETEAAGKLTKAQVERQHVRNLQHNKVIVVDGPKGQTVVCGSTNFSWRGFYVQNNNAVVVHGATPVAVYQQAFDEYWKQ